MITLYTLPPAFGFRNVSPFCLKTEMLLTHLALNYDTVLEKDPRKTPKGKLPWLDLDGKVIADSELIFMALDEHTGGGVYGGIDPVDRARGAYFLFALDQILQLHRQAANRFHPGLGAVDVREHLAFVVRRAAGHDIAVAKRRLEGRRIPFLQRLWWLHVVMAVYQHRWGTLDWRRFRIDDRVPIGGN